MTECEVSTDSSRRDSPHLSEESGSGRNGGPQYGSVATNSATSYTYEELSNGFSCPTCQGSGKIPRGREDDLVALIPYNDARLKPRRTCLYVFLSVFVCAVIAGVLVAFLFPRPISLRQEGRVKTVDSSYNETIPNLQLTLEIGFDVYNDNFVSIHVPSLTIQASWSGEAIGSNMTIFNLSMNGRNDDKFSANVTVGFTDSLVVTHCTDKQITTHSIYVQFTATLQYKLLYQNQQVTIIFYKIVDCEPIDEAEVPRWPPP